MNSALRAHREEEGFTLIELLVVVIIIGILAAIAIPAFLNQRERAWQSELTSTVRNVALEVEAEATAFGGDYTDVDDDTTDEATDFTDFVSAELTALQGAGGPVTFAAADASVTATDFSICMEHTSLVDGANPNGAVTYDSDGGGLQDFVQGAC